MLDSLLPDSEYVSSVPLPFFDSASSSSNTSSSFAGDVNKSLEIELRDFFQALRRSLNWAVLWRVVSLWNSLEISKRCRIARVSFVLSWLNNITSVQSYTFFPPFTYANYLTSDPVIRKNEPTRQITLKDLNFVGKSRCWHWQKIMLQSVPNSANH